MEICVDITIYSFGSLLIETSQEEDRAQLHAYMMELFADVYGKKPEWLRFSVGNRFQYRGIFYREFLCPAGSVDGRIQLHAKKPGGISRAIILRGKRSGTACCHAIHGGIEVEFDCSELIQT